MDWQGIDSAPRHKEIIVWGRFHGDYGYTPDSEGWTGARWDGTRQRWEVTRPTARYFNGFTPTHWIDLPEPPK